MYISVIIPFHREIKLIGRAVQSVLINKSSDDDFEIIICNDGEYTEVQILESISQADRKLVKIVKNRWPQGPGGARNTGLDLAQGDVIAFLDADDIWFKEKIKSQKCRLMAGFTFVTTNYVFEGSGVVVAAPKNIVKPSEVFSKRGVGTSTVMLAKSILGDLRFRDIRFAQDIDFWFRLAQVEGFRYSAVENILVEYSTGGSTKNKLRQLFYFYKILAINSLPIIDRIKAMTSYIISGVVNHYVKKIFN